MIQARGAVYGKTEKQKNATPAGLPSAYQKYAKAAKTEVLV